MNTNLFAPSTKTEPSEIDHVLNNLGKNLNPPDYLLQKVTKEYRTLGEYLSRPGGLLSAYGLLLSGVGSWLTNTLIKPVRGGERIDVDLTVQLKSPPSGMSMAYFKDLLFKELSLSPKYRDILIVPDGKRCWQLKFGLKSDGSYEFSMDLLICLGGLDVQVDRNWLESYSKDSSFDELKVIYTDRGLDRKLGGSYYEQVIPYDLWPVSNPFGYAIWFDRKASTYSIDELKKSEVRAETDPLTTQKVRKRVLERVVQILKYHRGRCFEVRDMDGRAPSSIILTTLAAQVYDGQTNLRLALRDVASKLTAGFIKQESSGMPVSYSLPNPVCPDENFMDKWSSDASRPLGFYNWLNALRNDLNLSSGKLMESDRKILRKAFGDEITELSTRSLGRGAALGAAPPMAFNPTSGHHESGGSIRPKPHKNFGL